MLSNESIFKYFEKKVLYFSDQVKFSNLSGNKPETLRLVIDSDSCMSRLTGGCYPDWQSGGQWKHLSYFYTDLKAACAQNSLEIVIFFNGAQEDYELWKHKQFDIKKKTNRIFSSEGSPRMTNWIEPCFSKQSIISEINHDLFEEIKNRNMFCYATMYQHKKEIVHYLIENECHGLLTDDFELITLVYANQENQENLRKLKFYSGDKFKLSTRKEISSYSYDINTALELFNLPTSKMILLSILITFGQSGQNYLKKYIKTMSKFELEDNNLIIIENIVNYVKNLREPFDLDAVVIDIFDYSVEMLKKMKEKISDKISWFNSIELGKKFCWARTKTDLKHNEFFEKINSRYSNDKSVNNSIEAEGESVTILQHDFDFKLEQLHANCIISPVLMKLYREKEIFLPVLLEKENGEFPKADWIFQDVRKNCYRVLFSGIEKVQVKEIFLSADGRTMEERLVAVEPCFKKKNIQAIWNLDVNSRKSLWFNCIGSSYDQGSREVFKTSYEMFLPCLVLQILIKKKLLNELDLKAFLYTFDKLRSGKKRVFEKNRNLRATNLATIFLHGIEMLDLLNHATGNSFKARFFKIKNFFDGNIFQMIYERVYSNDPELSYKSDRFNVIEMHKFVTKNIQIDDLPSAKKFVPITKEPRTRMNFVGRGRPMGLLNSSFNCSQWRDIDQSDSVSYSEEENTVRHSSPNFNSMTDNDKNESNQKITLEYLLLNNN